MIRSKDDLTNYIYRYKNGGICPIDGDWFEPNGTGDESRPVLRWFMRTFVPWDDILNETAVPVHDFRFKIGDHKYNFTFNETNKEFKHNIVAAMDKYISDKPIRRFLFNKWLYESIDEIYKYFVSGEKGLEAWKRAR